MILLALTAAGATPLTEALDAVVVAERLVYVAPGGRRLAAVDVTTGTELWSVPLAAPADAAVIHQLEPGRVLVQAARHYTAVDVATGSVLATREAPPSWTFVHRGHGGCALRSECSLEPISCADGTPVGPPLTAGIAWSHEGALEDVTPVCSGATELLAGTDRVTLLLTETVDGRPVVARDPDGATRWTSAAVGCGACAPLGAGASDDGDLCWTTDRGDAIVVRGFACDTGAARFTETLSAQPVPGFGEVITGWSEAAGAIVVSLPGRALALRPDATRAWQADLPPDAVAQLSDLRVPSYPLPLSARATAAVDPATGAVGDVRRLSEEEELRVDADGHLGVVPRGATTDRGGAHVAAPRVFSFRRDRTGSSARVGEQTVLSLPGDGWVLGEHRTTEAAWLVVTEARPGRPDRVHVLRQPPDGAR